MGSDPPLSAMSITSPWCFNPRSRMGSDELSFCVTPPSQCFNPRSRMGSDSSVWSMVLRQVFQPTLPHGERRLRYAGSMSWRQFQPTLPHGERLPNVLKFVHLFDVSTHAPAWGATFIVLSLQPVLQFQPTLPHGERRCDNC